MSHQTVCDLAHEHQQLYVDCVELINRAARLADSAGDDDVIRLLNQIEQRIDDMDATTQNIKRKAQRMEQRLNSYRVAIEQLGFIRQPHHN